ncbi:PREDICTED: uncharacterized protein LOC105566670 [Vollenhovia emeryi]|uniref:uncharacterized protein LOC105566670 n=1 Tax=Vollenhovia emeryi TaxID=411798 RepID=UPI0005F49B84|nr:PREDICTED: uncharacterized protein LOC105566670 [Vollenhovia emeryi]
MFNAQATQRLDEMEKKTIPVIEIDAESSAKFTLLELLTDVWDASFSAKRNIRLVIAMMAGYIARSGKVATRRMREGQEMKSILQEMYSLWVRMKGSMNAVCSKREMQTFVKCIAPKELHVKLVKGIMTEDTFQEWVIEYQRQFGILKMDSASDKPEELDDGMDSLFESVAEPTSQNVTTVQNSIVVQEPISQNITRMQNGRLHITKTPGEMDGQLVRMQVFNIDDIKDIEKRNWWKRAKLRAQFLYSSMRMDLKHQALCQLLEAVVSDLRSVPGVKTETRDLFYSDDACPERKRKRYDNDDIAIASGS